MRGYKVGLIDSVICVGVVLFMWGFAFRAEARSSGYKPPDGLIMEEVFKPGMGHPVGNILLVQGQVVIMHADMSRGYWARRSTPLFKGDAILTQERGRVSLRLRDESILNLGSRSRLVLSESVYDKKKKSRFSFIKMGIGKARFLVKKLVDLKRSNFKVKTPTAVLGVRGSDFIIEVEPGRTDVTALGDTRLEVVSLAAPEAPPTEVDDFEKTTIEEGELPTEPEDATPEKIEEDLKDVTVTPEPEEPEIKEEVEEEEGKKEPAKEPVAPSVEPGAEVEVAEGEVLVPENELVEPEVDIEEGEEIGEIEEPDTGDVVDPAGRQEEIQEQQDDVQQTIIEEETVVQELPDFPGHPEP